MDPISHAIFGATLAELFGLDLITAIFCATFIDLDTFLQDKKFGPFEGGNLFHYFPFFLVIAIPMLLLRTPIFGLEVVLMSAAVGFVAHFFGEMVLDHEGWTVFPGVNILLWKARPDVIVTFRGKKFTELDTRAIFLDNCTIQNERKRE